MTRNRIVWALLWILSLVGISFYGGPVSYGFFAVLTLIPVICLVYLLMVLACFKMYQRFTVPGIVCNHSVPFYFILQNEDLFSFAGIRVTFYSDFSQIDGVDDETEYELLPHTNIKKETDMVCRYRGEYNVGIKSVILRDFFCLFKLTYRNREPMKVKVLPDIINLENLQDVDIDSVSDKNTSSSLSHPDVTIREYIPGDDIRRMHWKQTARTGKPMVRNYIGEEKEGIGILLHSHRISSDPKEYLPVENRMLEIVIALALLFRERSIPATVCYYAKDPGLQIVDSADSFQALYKAMSDINFEEGEVSGCLYDAMMAGDAFSKKILFLVAPEMDEEVSAVLDRLRESDAEVILYLVRSGVEKEVTKLSPHITARTIPTDGQLPDLL
ncbi:MAG: DUF58 domain-containing protein [Lachnospiraceae bacterium]|nr:DUF58 domain-containing protein [Lachnospiraceae bacterium]